MPLPSHAHALYKFNELLIGELNTSELKDELQGFPNVRVEGPNKKKVPDNGWGPIRKPPGRREEWAAVVLEVGVSEHKSKLQSDAQWWLNNSNGEVKIVFTMSVDRRRLQIIITKWELENNQPGVTQIVTLWKDKIGDDEEIKTSGAPLRIEFNKLFLREPAAPNEQDIQIKEINLRRLARTVWRIQEF
jgi:hypothetical protein